jgi:lipoprotein-releasing system permease protein
LFRTFLSLRYFVARRTNLIGTVGIFVAVGALIMILSIMTGFLEQTRSVIRGSLCDILIEPHFHRLYGDYPGRRSPAPMLDVLHAQPGVESATAQLLWGGILTQSQGQGARMERILSSASGGQLLLVQLVGVDVRSAERIAWPALAAAHLARGAAPPPRELHDEINTTDFLSFLLRSTPDEEEKQDDPFRRRISSAPIPNPLFPFAPPPGLEAWERPPPRVVLGQRLFHDLGLERWEVMGITTAVHDPRTDEWVTNNRDFLVAGTFCSRDNEIDAGRIYLPRSELFDFLGRSRPYTQILVRLDDYEGDGERLEGELLEVLAAQGMITGSPGEVRTWERFRINLLGAIENERVLMGIMLSLVLVVAGFTIFAILSMMVTEKRRDIGILCALGSTPRGIVEVFLMIAFWDALIGSILGTVAGVWAALEIDAIERWLSATITTVVNWFRPEYGEFQIFNRDVYLFDHLPSAVDPFAVGLIVLGAFVCTLLFALIPAWRAARMDPLKALRYE